MPRNDEQGHDCLEQVIDRIISLGEGKRTVAVDEIKKAIGQRSFGLFLFVPAILEISPVGGIPGLPTVLALIIVLFALQLLIGRREFWIPGFIARRSVKSDKLEKGLNKVRPVVRWLDRISRKRLPWATGSGFLKIIAATCIVLAASVPPLELLPFASTAPFSAICLFGLGITTRDGALILLGLIVAVGAFVLLGTGFIG